jgi:glycosyltransferase involved in cell wall biosynthesis
MQNQYSSAGSPETKKYSVSVIIPARNEKGNIAGAVAQMPSMGRSTEIIFVEGGSSDGTLEEIKKVVLGQSRFDISVRYLVQSAKGKGNAVKEGFFVANGEILMILDADLTVAPSELPEFYNALASGRAEFVNANRLFYKLSKGAMPFKNWLGNKFFAILFSLITGHKMHDILCGTKVMFKKDFEKMEQNRVHLGASDPGGDLDFLFGAAFLRLRMEELPVHYTERTYGSSNFQHFSHAWKLFKICLSMVGKGFK